MYTRDEHLRLLLGGLLGIAVTAAEVATAAIFDDITNKVFDARHLAGFWKAPPRRPHGPPGR